MTFTTMSGSVYQVDAEERRIRQVKLGERRGTWSTRHEGDWWTYEHLEIHPGESAIVIGAGNYIMRTSRVVSVTPCLN